MKFMHPANCLAKLFVSLFVIIALAGASAAAQTKKKTASKPASKKSAVAKKDARKSSSRTSAKNTRSKSPKKMTAAERRAEAARKKKEEARRQAALAEQRRREQAAREARARKLAFERGLRNETQANIAKDDTTGEDLRVRQVAVDALGERAGTVVVMEAKTGRVVTMVNQDWAIREGFKPCSTIKLVTGVAGVNEKLIDPQGNITGDSMKMDLNDALAYSNNAYFQRVGVRMGNEKMIEYAKDLGLGQPTGINAENEFAGKLPYGNKNARIYSHADDFEVTPLQLAVMVTAISNGGKRIVPQFRRPRVERSSFRAVVRDETSVQEGELRGVIPGMIGAAEYGTARRGMDQSLGVAGKTGSCIGRGTWVGLFASVAPVEDPLYSVVVITKGEGERGRIAAGIASKIYTALAPTINRDQTRFLALKRNNDRPRVDTMLAEADEEDDDSDSPEADVVVEPKRTVTTIASQRPVNQPQAAKPSVVRTTDSKPVAKPNFPPVVINYSKDATAPAANTPKPAPVKTANNARPTATKPAAKSSSTPTGSTKKSAPVRSSKKPEPNKASAASSKNAKSTSAKPSAKKEPAKNSKTTKAKETRKPEPKKSTTRSSTSKTSKKEPAKKPAAKKADPKKDTKVAGKTRPRVVKNR